MWPITGVLCCCFLFVFAFRAFVQRRPDFSICGLVPCRSGPYVLASAHFLFCKTQEPFLLPLFDFDPQIKSPSFPSFPLKPVPSPFLFSPFWRSHSRAVPSLFKRSTTVNLIVAFFSTLFFPRRRIYLKALRCEFPPNLSFFQLSYFFLLCPIIGTLNKI